MAYPHYPKFPISISVEPSILLHRAIILLDLVFRVVPYHPGGSFIIRYFPIKEAFAKSLKCLFIRGAYGHQRVVQAQYGAQRNIDVCTMLPAVPYNLSISSFKISRCFVATV